jgi:hypothetical protein
MKRISSLLVLLWYMFASTTFAQSANESFQIRAVTASESNPPTTPVLLSAEPFSTSQINLSWAAATDDSAVVGYVLYRDGTPIATTTQLTYSDLGLAPSTTYAYNVYAYDLWRNYSSSSNSLATTTFNLPPANVSLSNEQSGTVARVVLQSFTVDVGVATTAISLETTHPARIEVRWGRTDVYELGYVVGGLHTREYEVLLTDLEPGTTYEYEVTGYTPYGRGMVLRTGSFTTEEEQVVLPPANVRGFRALVEDNDVSLVWDSPVGEDATVVRVVRSHLGFPEHPQAGAVVYEGEGRSARDVGVLAQYSPVYYTAFVYDRYGNVSSGAVQVVYRPNQTAETPGLGSDDAPASASGLGGSSGSGPGDLPVAVPEATSTVYEERVSPEMRMPALSDITVSQGDVVFGFDRSDIALVVDDRFTVSVPVEAVAGNLKSIIVTIVNPTDNRLNESYLLRINKDRTAYEASMTGFAVAGRSELQLAIYDYEALVVAEYTTPVSFVLSVEDESSEVLFPDQLYWLIPTFLFLCLLLLVIVLRLKAEDKKP